MSVKCFVINITNNLNHILSILVLGKSENFSYIHFAKLIESVEMLKRPESCLIPYNKYEYYTAPELRSSSERSADQFKVSNCVVQGLKLTCSAYKRVYSHM
jgi:hypothetical protein